MKTTFNTLADYRDAKLEKELNPADLEHFLEKEIKYVTRKYKHQENVNDVQKGDIVILNSESQFLKFHFQSLKLAVGSSLFDKDFEAALIGLHVNEEKELKIHDEKVKVKILQSTRTIYPKVDNQMIEEFVSDKVELKHIQTVNEYKAYLIETYKQQAYEEIMNKNLYIIIDYVMTHSDWNFDEKELDDFIQQYMEDIDEELKNEGKTFKELTTEDLQMYFDVKDFDEFNHMVRNMVEYTVACGVFEAILNDKDPKTLTLEEAEELGWKILEDYVKEQIGEIWKE